MSNKQHLIEYSALTHKEFESILADRKICIWGADYRGRGMLSALKREGFKVGLIADSSNAHIGSAIDDVVVLNAKELFQDKTEHNISPDEYLIILATNGKDTLVKMSKTLGEKGFFKGKDFLPMSRLCQFVPTIDISGVCNFKCIACPRGDTLRPFSKGGYMSAEKYEQILKKMLAEMPFLSSVSLFVWGEPLLNPHLPEIIEISNKYAIGTSISTNLSVGKHLEEVIKAAPTQIAAAVSGYGEGHYQITQVGARWDNFYTNLCKMAEYREKYDYRGIMQVNYHLNNENIDEYEKMAELCVKLNIPIKAVPQLVFNDLLMNYFDGEELSDNAKKAIDLFLIPFNEYAIHFQSEHEMRCRYVTTFPNICWDGSVYACAQYRDEKLADDYLNTTIDDLIKRHNSSSLCERCMKHSLHRYPNVTLMANAINEIMFKRKQKQNIVELKIPDKPVDGCE